MLKLKSFLLIVIVLPVLGCSWLPQPGSQIAPIKPPDDQREYRVRQLDNGLRVLLVSDPETDKAGASLNVNVGSGQDPADFQGLAHFLEHMLFLGTGKYPKAGEYQEFISGHGGSHNAFTGFEDTNYFFDISADYLEPALDRFAQFFVAPLFNAEYVQREVNAVNSEYRSKIRDDRRRELAVFKSQVNPQHPFAKFSVGNLETLQSDQPEALRAALLRFYQAHYSADIMTLSVIGRQSLDELEAMVLPRFEGVKDRQAAADDIAQPLFAPGTLPRQISITPVQERRVLSLSFPVPDPKPYWHTKPLNYIGNVLGHEGEGSLLSVLKVRGWAESLSAGESLSYAGGAMFGVDVYLTPGGQAHTDEIVALLFENVRQLREQGIEAWRFDEQAKLAQQQFLFRTLPAVSQDVISLSMGLREYPSVEVIRGDYLMDQFDAAVIGQFVEALRPDNVLVTLVAPEAKVDQHIARYQVDYAVNAISAEQQQRWQQPPMSALALPQANPFIADDFTLVARAKSDEGDRPVKLAVQENEPAGLQLWLNTDDEFEVPKGRVFLLLETPHATGSLDEDVKTELWLKMVRDQLNELAYPAQLAGLNFSLDGNWRGIEIGLAGYDQKQGELLAAVLKGLMQTEWQQARFDRLKALRLRQLANADKRSPYEQLVAELPRALQRGQYSIAALSKATAALQMPDVQAHADTLRRGFGLTLLVDGNFAVEDARQLASIASQSVTVTDAPPARQEVVTLPQAQYRWPVAAQHDDAAVLTYLQGPEQGNTARVTLGLVAQMMNADFYYQLRTQKQLGYIVNAGAYPIRDIPGLIFLVQSPVADAASLQGEIDGYISTWLANGVSAETFEKHKATLSLRLAEQPENIFDAADRHWRDLLEDYADFDSREQLVAALAALDYDHWWAGVEQALSSRRTLTLYAKGKWPQQEVPGTRPDSLQSFKQTSPVSVFH